MVEGERWLFERGQEVPRKTFTREGVMTMRATRDGLGLEEDSKDG